ncbi:hypothetical protein FRC03_010068 [Tulasnella sp. 419]|nr:hypothetical protein FRC03_010068 [Tulasnella sp. 419]
MNQENASSSIPCFDELDELDSSSGSSRSRLRRQTHDEAHTTYLEGRESVVTQTTSSLESPPRSSFIEMNDENREQDEPTQNDIALSEHSPPPVIEHVGVDQRSNADGDVSVPIASEPANAGEMLGSVDASETRMDEETHNYSENVDPHGGADNEPEPSSHPSCTLADGTQESPETSRLFDDSGDASSLFSGGSLEDDRLHSVSPEVQRIDAGQVIDLPPSGALLPTIQLVLPKKIGDIEPRECPSSRQTTTVPMDTESYPEHQPLQNISNNQFESASPEPPPSSPLRCLSEIHSESNKFGKSPSTLEDNMVIDRSRPDSMTPGFQGKLNRLAIGTPAPNRPTPFNLISPMRSSSRRSFHKTLSRHANEERQFDLTPMPEHRSEMSLDAPDRDDIISEEEDEDEDAEGEPEEEDEAAEEEEEDWETEADCEAIWPTLTEEVDIATIPQPDDRQPIPISVNDIVQIRLKDRKYNGPDLVCIDEIKINRSPETNSVVYYFMMHWFWEPREFMQDWQVTPVTKNLPFNHKHLGKMEMIEAPDHVQVLSSRFDIRPYSKFMRFESDDISQPVIPGEYRYSRIKYNFNRKRRHDVPDKVPTNKCMCGSDPRAASSSPSKLKSPSKSNKASGAKVTPGYNPDTDIQYYCPRSICRRWLHETCLKPKDRAEISDGYLQDGETFESRLETFTEDSDVKLEILHDESPRKRARTSHSTSRPVFSAGRPASHKPPPTPPNSKAYRIFGKRLYMGRNMDIYRLIRGIARRQIIRGGPNGVVGNGRGIYAARQLVSLINSDAPQEAFEGWHDRIPDDLYADQIKNPPPPLTGCWVCPFCRGPI